MYAKPDDGLWSLQADHAGKRRLTQGDDYAPKFSPDGTRIAFVRDGQLCVMQADGSKVTILADGYMVLNYDFSPDGTRIIFSAVQGQ